MFEKSGYQSNQMEGAAVRGALGGVTGGVSMSQIHPPVPTGSLSDAMNRLGSAIASTDSFSVEIVQRLEAAGVLRPSVPSPDSAGNVKTGGMESQLAQALLSLARLLETHNARLADIVNRIDH